MSILDAIGQRELLAGQLRAALAALESDDAPALQHALDDVIACDQRPLAIGVARLAREVRDTLRELDLDSRIADLAGGEISDACNHLDHVVRMTEDAAHRTLDLVDDSRAAMADLGQRHAIAADDEAYVRLRGNMLSLAMAQEYQDLSGQLIRRVIRLVRNVEAALGDLVQLARPALKDQPRAPIAVQEAPPSTDLKGPAAAVSASQQDADALLADLGF